MSGSRWNFAQHGFEIRSGVLDATLVAAVQSEVRLDHELLRRTGIRNLEKKFQSIAKIAGSTAVQSIAKAVLGGDPRLVRALFFDKTPDRNWSVGWHQDRTVTLNQRIESEGWRLWTLKEGVHHVQPPREVLDEMVTIRLHLDPTDRNSGCLSLIPGSHVHGVLTASEIRRAVARARAECCALETGDALVMHPLLLHSSPKSRKNAHRRVVHMEYSSYDLPAGVCWA